MQSKGQNAILNQFQFPMAIKGELAEGQLLVYDAKIRKFVNIDPSMIDFKQDTINEIKTWYTLAVEERYSYTIPWAETDKTHLLITLDGVKQLTNAYDVFVQGNSTIVTFVEPIAIGTDIEIIGLLTDEPCYVQNITLTANGVDLSYNIPWVATTKDSLFIYTFGGVKQQTGAYDIEVFGGYTRITFVEAVPASELIEIVGLIGNFSGSSQIPIESIDGVNLGVAVGQVFSNITSVGGLRTLNFRSLSAGPGTSITQTADLITIGSTLSDFENLGNGEPIAVTPLVTNPSFKTLLVTGNGSISSTADEITINVGENADTLAGKTGAEYATTLESVGTGISLVVKSDAAPNSTLNIKSLLATGDIILVDTPDKIIISSNRGFGYTFTEFSYNAQPQDHIIGCRNASPINIILPSPALATHGHKFIIKDEMGTASLANITVTTAAGLIENTTSVVLNSDFGSLEFYSNGTNWFKI